MPQETEANINLALIKKLNDANSKDRSIYEKTSVGWCGIVELPPLKGMKSNRYYAVNKDHPLGLGGYGIVYEAKEIDPKTGEILEGAKPLAVKIFHKKEDADKQEIVDIQGRYFRDTRLIEDTQLTSLVTELLRGQDLEKFIQTDEFKNLSYEHRIELIQQIILALNVMQNETPSTGEGLMHNDLKLGNIMVFLEKVEKTGKIKFNAHIIDLGLARVKEEGEVGLNNDIYCLGIIIQVLLRDSAGITPANIQDLVTKFSSRMVSFKHQPDSDECLRFINEVRKYSQLQELIQATKDPSEKHGLENDLKICQAKLELLANGHWAQEIGSRSIEKWKSEDLENTDLIQEPITTETVQTTQTVGNFLESYPEMTLMAADLFEGYGKKAWFSGFLQKMSEFLDAYPKMETFIANAYEKTKENISEFAQVLQIIKEFLYENPEMEEGFADLGFDEFARIKASHSHPWSENKWSSRDDSSKEKTGVPSELFDHIKEKISTDNRAFPEKILEKTIDHESVDSELESESDGDKAPSVQLPRR